jgi:AcrR family transcriptional regulator
MISLLEQIEETADPRRARILAGATKVFLAYGFQRTTMDDIARAAEISRPALYLHFRNKTDIYRALASAFLEQAIDRTREALGREGISLEERINAATSCFMTLLDEIENSPHGQELLDMQNSLAKDIVAAGRSEMADMFTEAIEAELAVCGCDLARTGITASGLADLLLDALDGMKMRQPDRETQSRLHAEYVCVVAALLER